MLITILAIYFFVQIVSDLNHMLFEKRVRLVDIEGQLIRTVQTYWLTWTVPWVLMAILLHTPLDIYLFSMGFVFLMGYLVYPYRKDSLDRVILGVFVPVSLYLAVVWFKTDAMTILGVLLSLFFVSTNKPRYGYL